MSAYLLFFIVLVLINGCSISPSTLKVIETFHLYDAAETKNKFCKNHLELGMRAQECVNNLVVFTRLQKACKKSVADKSCYIRNINRWDYYNGNMETATGYVNKKFSLKIFDNTMYEEAKTFELTCFNNSKNLVPCGSISKQSSQ